MQGLSLDSGYDYAFMSKIFISHTNSPWPAGDPIKEMYPWISKNVQWTNLNSK